MNEKFKLTDETLSFEGHVLHRIKALKAFSDVKKGELGGWLEYESNLSCMDDCWVYNHAKVFDNAYVSGNAKIKNIAVVKDSAEVEGHAGQRPGFAHSR